MLFSSIPFLYYFLPVTVILYLAAPRKLKNTVLLVASMFFYAWGEKLLVILFAATIFTGWLLSLYIEKSEGKKRKFLATISIIIDVALLGYFKYTDFFISNINAVTGLSIPLLKIALPIGISFYTFQILGYTIDVYRGTVPAQKNLINFAAYVSLFPQLIAGPIVRYSDIADQLDNRKHSLSAIEPGIIRFTVGLGKKVLLANTIGEICTQFRTTNEPSVIFYWLYAVSFMLQIYFDFSGYSDMAIGLGRMFGFSFLENFNYPYISGNITEFWRRWHISLGSWFRDYIYIPLGGNRCSKARQLFNIAVVWMLTGFWHGAAWNFVIWGVYFAALLTVEKFFLKSFLDKHKTISHIYTLFAVLIGFVIFNAADMGQAASDVAGLFAFNRLPIINSITSYYLTSYGVILLFGLVGATPLPKIAIEKISENRYGKLITDILTPIFVICILLVVTAFLVDGSFNPFLYFRF